MCGTVSLTSDCALSTAFSPEREDPGNRQHEMCSIPKVVGGNLWNNTFHASARFMHPPMDHMLAFATCVMIICACAVYSAGVDGPSGLVAEALYKVCETKHLSETHHFEA